MQRNKIRSINRRSRYPSAWLLAAAIGLCPAAAGAGVLGPGDTATGTNALANENGGHANTADGFSTLFSNISGYSSTAVGAYTLYSNTVGAFNTGLGANALYFNTTGHDNTATGYGALGYNNTGYNNTAIGTTALYSNTKGINNVALGFQALNANVRGNNNVAVGANALLALKGSNNIALGNKSGRLTTSGNANIYIGHPGVNGSENNVVRIGKAQTKTFIAGIAGVPLSGATVVVRASGQLGIVASSARYKQDINALDDASSKLASLRPVSFRYRGEPKATHYGLIAEEVDKVMPELVVRDDKNRPESVQYQELIPLLLQQWKAQQAEIARQRALIERQQDRLDRQEAELAELGRTLATRLAAFDTGIK
jgi:hypothetical protein